MASPQLPRFARMSQTTVLQWNDGSPFTGFMLIGLVLPATYTKGFYASVYPSVSVPTFLKIPISNGTFHNAAGVLYNADIEPVNSQYVSWYYDSAGHLVSGPSAFFTASTAILSTAAIITFTAPAAGAVAPTPNSGPI